MSAYAEPSSARYDFSELLQALDRGRAGALERLLRDVARRFRVLRDDVWTAMSELWRYVLDERRTLDEWLHSVRAWLRRPETRSLIYGAGGIRRADVERARRDGKTARESRRERLEEAWATWTPANDAPDLRADVALCGRLLAAVTAGDDRAETLALRMRVAGLDTGDIAAELGLASSAVEAQVAAGRRRLLGRVGPNAAFALRRVLGEDNGDLARATGLAPAAVRMKVARGRRELSALVAATR